MRRGFLLGLEATRMLLRRQEARLRLYAGLIQLSATLCSLQEPRLAARLAGAAETFRACYAVSLPTSEHVRCARDLTTVQALKNDATLAAAWAEGRQLPLEDVLAQVERLAETLEAVPANETPGSPPPPAAVPPSPGAPLASPNLTSREQEVLRLLAQGLTNPQIAEALVISPRTVNTHVVAIFNKLAVNSRAAATRAAVEGHLV